MTLRTSAVAVCCCSRFAQFVEQARVLDGDDGLRGEILQQFDLLIGERAHLLAVNSDRADQLVVLEHRYDKKSPKSAETDGGNEKRFPLDVGRFLFDVGDMNSLLCLLQRALRAGPGPGRCGPLCQNSANFGGTPNSAAALTASSSTRNNMPKLASQIRTAFSSIAWNTGSNSPGD